MVYNDCCFGWSHVFGEAVGEVAVRLPSKVILMLVTRCCHLLMLLLRDCASRATVRVLIVVALVTDPWRHVDRKRMD